MNAVGLQTVCKYLSRYPLTNEEYEHKFLSHLFYLRDSPDAVQMMNLSVYTSCILTVLINNIRRNQKHLNKLRQSMPIAGSLSEELHDIDEVFISDVFCT